MKKFLLLATIIFFTPAARAQTNVQVKKIHKHEAVFKQIQKDDEMRLKSLKGLVAPRDLRHALVLKEAIDDLKDHQPQKSYEQLKKLSKRSLFADYIRYYRGLSLMELNDPEAAVAELPMPESFKRKADWEQVWLRWQGLASLKKTDTLSQEIRGLKRKYGNNAWLSLSSDYFLGRAHYLNKNTKLAFSHFKNILVTNPGSDYDEKIFTLTGYNDIATNDLLSEADWNMRASRLEDNGFPDRALAIWSAFAKSKQGYEEKVARGYFRARRYPEAAERFEQLLQNNGHSKLDMRLLVSLAQSYARQDNFTKAIETYEKLLQIHPQSEAAHLARYKLAFLHFDSGQYDEAASLFLPFSKNGSARQREQSHWYRVWCYYFTNQYDLAISELASLEKLGKKRREKSAVTYWQARIHEKMDDVQRAKDLYQILTEIDPDGYYGLLAGNRLCHKNLFVRTLVDPEILTHVPKALMLNETNLLTTFPSPELARAALLYNMGLDSDAFDELKNSTMSESLSVRDGALAFYMGGDFNRGLNRKKTLLSGNIPGIDLSLAYALAYPRGYAKYIEPFSELYKLDPRLAYAVMQQESAFRPEARSFVAYGLMQIIPPTAEQIASDLKFTGFKTSDLSKPLVNTFFGTYYLRTLLNSFKGELVHALAAYNAGPEAVRRWLAKAENLENDEFIELIPYSETRNYVKKVMVNYLMYTRLYNLRKTSLR